MAEDTQEYAQVYNPAIPRRRPEISLPYTEAIAERVKLTGNTMSTYAKDILTNGGEKATAQYLATHEVIDRIMQSTQLRDPSERAAYIEAVYEAVKALSSGLSNGGPETGTRQQLISQNSHQLKEAVRTAIANIGGSVGPTGNRPLSDYELVRPKK